MSKFITRRFGRGQGLEVSAAVQTQRGLSKLENPDLTLRDVIRKASGTIAYTPTRSADPADVIPASETRAVHARYEEINLETENRLYSLARCAGVDAGTTTVGTATPAEISDALDDITTRASTEQRFTIGLPGDPKVGDVQTRLDRPDIQDPLVQVAPRATTTTITEPEPGRLSWTVVEGATTNGPNELPSQASTSLMRLARMQVIAGTQDVLVTYLDQGGLRAVLLKLDANPAAIILVNYGILAAVRGAADGARYEARDGVIAALERGASAALKVWDASDPINTLRAYTPATSIPPDTASGAYQLDLAAPGGYSAGMAVAWTSPDDGSISWAALRNTVGNIQNEVAAATIGATVDRVAIEQSLTADPRRYVIGMRPTGQKPVCEVGSLDTVFRLVANTITTDLVYTRTSTLELARWESAAGNITEDTAIFAVANPVDAVGHRDASGVYLAVVDDAGFQEVRTDRNLQPPPATLRKAGIQAIGVVGSPTRTVYCYRSNPAQITVGTYTDTQDATPTDTPFSISQDVDVSGPQAIGILAEGGVDDVKVRFYALQDAATQTVYAATLDTTTGDPEDIETHILDTLPLVLSATPAGVIPRALLGVSSTSLSVWEDSPTLFVKVSPPGTALVSGSWIDRGPWTRLRHRTQRARTSLNAAINQCDAVTALSAQGVECTLAITEQVGAGIVADILSTYVEFSGTIVAQGDGLNPRTGYYGGDKGAVGYVDPKNSNVIRLAIWTPGEGLSFFDSGVSANGPTGVWDLSGGVTGDGIPFTFTVGCKSATDFELELRSSFGSVVVIVPTGQTIVDVCGFSRPAAGASAHASVSVALANSTFATYDYTLLPAVNTITPNWSRVVALTGVPVAVSTSVESDLAAHTVWVELPYLLGLSREVRLFDVQSGSDAPITVSTGGIDLDSIQYAALYSQQAVVLGQTVGCVELLAEELTDLPFISGILMIAGRTQEVVGRSALGATSTMRAPNTRDDRYPHGSLVPDSSGGVTMGAELRDINRRDRKAVQAQVLRWPRGPDPHRPAVVDAVSYAAKGGFPAQYDGERAYETDWHSLPRAGLVTAVDGSSALTPGSYLVALTWEYENFQGQLERSAPTLLGPVVVAAGEIINVNYFGLPMTGRDRPRVTVWRSIADGISTELYLDGEDFAQITSGQNTISLFQSDDDIVANPFLLDQVAGGILTADRVDVTDFMAPANGRIWSVNPATPTYARYSLQQRDGFALHFSGAALLEHTREEVITSIHELSGRVIMFTANGVAYVHGDGPGNTGLGSYTVPMVEPVSFGAVSHSATIATPDGIAYEGGDGIRLLTRGLQALDMGDQVEAHASRDRFVAFVLTYTYGEELLYIGDADPLDARSLFIFHPESIRWGTWTSPTPRDLASTTDGHTVILSTAGRVHVTDRDVYTRGGDPYTFALETEWIRVANVPTHQAANFATIRGTGTYDGPHDVLVSVYADGVDVPVVAGLRASAVNVSVAASGRPYIWQLEIPGQLHYAIKYRISDNGEANPTFTLEALDSRFTPTGRQEFGDIPADEKVTA